MTPRNRDAHLPRSSAVRTFLIADIRDGVVIVGGGPRLRWLLGSCASGLRYGIKSGSEPASGEC